MLLGPTPLNSIYGRDTGIATSKGPLLLGPVWQNVSFHELVPTFLVLGKLVYLRRLAMEEVANVSVGDVNEYKNWMTSFGDQVLTGAEGEYNVFRLMIDSIDRSMTPRINQLKFLATQCDQHVETVIMTSPLAIRELGANELSINHVIENLIIYMRSNELYLEDSIGGFYRYLRFRFKDTRNAPADFPVSQNPRILDQWITNEIIPESDFL